MNEGKFVSWCRRLGAWMVLALWALPASAQTNGAREFPSRFLFVVDTSAAMRRRAPAVQKAVENLMRSGLNGQLRPGDTVGAWTFDEQLYAGRFPLQLWSAETSESVASNVVAFLKAQPYQKKSKFETVMPALDRIVRHSNKLTVLLVTDGNEKIFGTPFDREIQSMLDRHFKMQQQAREPFITVLRASRGQLINATVNLMPWPVEFPAFPPEPEPEPVAASKPSPPEQKPAPHAPVPSLIVIGKKPEPVAATNGIELAAVTTNLPGPAETINASITPTPPQLNPSEIRSAPAPAPSPASTDGGTPRTEPTAQAANPGVPPTTAAENAPPPIVETKPASAPAPLRSGEPTPTSPATKPAEPRTVTRSPEATSTPLAGSPTNEVAPSTPLAPVALAIQPEAGFPRLWMLAVGSALVLLVIGWFFVKQLRARNSGHVSLITRSMDRDNNQPPT